MVSSRLSDRARAWIDADPDPHTRAELSALLDDELALAERFSDTLHFGTAGLRGVVRAGPTGMNVATVTRATAAVGLWLNRHGRSGQTVVVGRDARHGSREFFTAATEVLAAQGFEVVALPEPAPTPLVAYATRALDAAAGVQITASHNPAADNGYKLYADGGRQIVSPDDTEIESLMADVGPANTVARLPVRPDARASDLRRGYLSRLTTLTSDTPPVPIRIALTPLHGVGGRLAVEALTAAGFDDIHVVASQFEPDPTFPTISFPNPEEPGAVDLLLATAADVDADIALALDPDADRVAVGVRDRAGWRMLTGDETGALLSAHLVSRPGPKTVASSIVSGTLAHEIAVAAGARAVRTLTGFKWLSRADDDQTEVPLRYAYEEAIGHCVDPDAVRDKDGISTAVLLASLARQRKSRGSNLLAGLDDLYRTHGVHVTGSRSLRLSSAVELAGVMSRLREHPPAQISGIAVELQDYSRRSDALRTDAVALSGESATGARLHVMVRPSGTEPKIKYYVEVVVGVDRYRDTRSLDDIKALAAELTHRALAELVV